MARVEATAEGSDVTVLALVGQAVSMWLMWRYRNPAPAEDGENNRSETETYVS